MSLRTYHGSCHCRRVRFEVDLDLSAGTSRCNCSICTKSRHWGAWVKPEAFRLLAGEDDLADYQFGAKNLHYRFCRTCGTMPYCNGSIEALGGAFVSVSVNCLDDVEPAALLAGPIQCMDGRHDNWMETPAETRHL